MTGGVARYPGIAHLPDGSVSRFPMGAICLYSGLLHKHLGAACGLPNRGKVLKPCVIFAPVSVSQPFIQPSSGGIGWLVKLELQYILVSKATALQSLLRLEWKL